MVLNGALAGLVTITAEPASPTPLLACLLGLLGGSLVVFSIVALDKAKIDDPVGAISVHGVCGALGIMLVPLSNSDATFVNQLIGLVCILGFVFIASSIVWAILKNTMGIRVTEEEELNGMDQHDCGIDAYLSLYQFAVTNFLVRASARTYNNHCVFKSKLYSGRAFFAFKISVFL